MHTSSEADTVNDSAVAQWPGRWFVFLYIVLLLPIAACSVQGESTTSGAQHQVTLTVDDQTHNLTSGATNVRELLEEAGITLNPADQVSPPAFTPLSDGMSVTVVRVTERIELTKESLPFDRKIVRSEAMEPDDPPRIVQGGRNGEQEITVRIVYHDGVEVERQRTQVTLIEEPRDEIVMIGVGGSSGALTFDGIIAYNSGGNVAVFRGSTLYPEQLNTGTNLDGRVFKLSPTGSHLLYTRVMTESEHFNNSLWVISTEEGAEPRRLDVQNVLWADWNPSRTASLQIAYTTGVSVTQPPGWEANNDLWLAAIHMNENFPFNPENIVDAYPATYGWWGGNYAWSPDGRYIAYAYADEVGIIDLEATNPEERRIQLHEFTEYNTRTDWVWVPTLTWSPNSRYLAFSSHEGTSPDGTSFAIRVADVASQIVLPFTDEVGMWSHPHWSTVSEGSFGNATSSSQIAYLQSSNPLDSLQSPYTLWLMDQDGSNTRQIYPPVGENSRFPREQQFMAWGPSGRDIALIFDQALYLFNLDRNEADRITQDDTVITRPTWAPYGAAIQGRVAPSEIIETPQPPNNESDLLPDN